MTLPSDNIIFPNSYAFFEGNHLILENEIESLLSSCNSVEEFQEQAEKLNGSWAAIIKKDNKIYAATDHRSTMPVYYRQSNDTIRFSTNGFDLIQPNERFNISSDDQLFFAQNGFLLGQKTLHPNIKRLQAGSLLYFDGKEIAISHYDHEINNLSAYSALSYTEAKRRFKQRLEEIFSNAKQLVGNRWIVLPLTGGKDSRLLACLLKKAGFKNVQCITYGIGKDCFESQKAKVIAQKLNYKHEFISSIPEDCGYEGYTEDRNAINYLKYISGLGSGYYYGEYLPAKWICQHFAPSELPIVIPGHNGDEIRGESLIHPYLLKRDCSKMIDALTMREGGNCAISRKQYLQLRKEIEQTIKTYPKIFDTLQLYEQYLNYEVMPKFYTNSAKSWRYFEIPVFLPLLDKELCELMFCIPAKYRWRRRLYEEVTNEYYTEFGVTFDDDTNSEKELSKLSFKIKEVIRPYIAPIWNKRSKLWLGDTIGFRTLMQGRLLEEVRQRSPFNPTTENGLAAAWLLLKIEDEYGLKTTRQSPSNNQ